VQTHSEQQKLKTNINSFFSSVKKVVIPIWNFTIAASFN